MHPQALQAGFLALSGRVGTLRGPFEGVGAGFNSCSLPDLSSSVGTGNCFYVSMPAGPLDSSTDPSGVPTSPSMSDGPATWQVAPQHCQQQQGALGVQRNPSCSPPSLMLRDTGLIFHTIEQLTLKLNRLKVRRQARVEGHGSPDSALVGATAPLPPLRN